MAAELDLVMELHTRSALHKLLFMDRGGVLSEAEKRSHSQSTTNCLFLYLLLLLLLCLQNTFGTVVGLWVTYQQEGYSGMHFQLPVAVCFPL